MLNERLDSLELIKMFHNSVFDVLEELDDTLNWIKKHEPKEHRDRAGKYRTQKILAAWFEKHGGLPV